MSNVRLSRAVERFFFSLAAAAAVVMAACISGMPSTSCAAMAQVYGDAIGKFGGVALAAVGAALYSTVFRPWLASHLAGR